MSTKTTNLELIKPELTDIADITTFNDNWDKIDKELKNVKDNTPEAYNLPTAGQNKLGGVKTTSNINNASGYTACPIISGVPYYKDTNTTYSEATTSKAGLMSASDKSKLNGINTTDFAAADHTHSEYMTKSNPSGKGSVSIGRIANSTIGQNSVAMGRDNIASGLASATIGTELIASSHYQAVVGKLNAEKDGYFIVGGGTFGDTDDENTRANFFRVGDDGNCYGSASFKSSGADYAEMFEWLDGNPDNEDRRGLFVTLDGEKIRLANADDDILGIISAMPSVMGDVSSEDWQGKYLKDIFGAYIWETVEIEEKTDENGEVIVPAHTEKQRVLNPDYDPNCEYVSREDRKEWDAVGFVGKLVMVDDGTCEVNGYCTATNGGKATKSDVKTNYRVLTRIDETHIKVFVR